MRRLPSIRSIPAAKAWALAESGEVRLLDLRTEAERRRHGWPPGAPRVSLARHIASPGGTDTIYLCQHANRSKLTARNGAAGVEDGWRGWKNAGMPIERERDASDG
jgi:rhodanese-related sulfurtransferase